MNSMLEKIRAWMAERPVMFRANSDPTYMMSLLWQEVMEFEKALREEPLENQHRELLDILWFSISISIILDMDVEKVFEEKLQRNSAKYPASEFQEGDYDEIYARLRREWNGV